MELRLAKYRDLSECVGIGETFWADSPYADVLPYNPSGVLGLLTALIQAELMLVVEHDGAIVATAACIVAALPFDPDVNVATEFFWYVAPEVRKRGIGQMLMDGLENVVKKKGAKIVSMGNMSTSDPKTAEKLLNKNGYKLTEKTFTKVL